MIAQLHDHHCIDPGWILLDSQSTVSIFNSSHMLTNIRDSGCTLQAFTKSRHKDSKLVGDFSNLREVWYNPKSIANISSLAHVCKVCQVTMDSNDTAAINIYCQDGTMMQFTEHHSGFYVFSPNASSDSLANYTMLSTVAKPKELFTCQQVCDANIAHKLYCKIGCPSGGIST